MAEMYNKSQVAELAGVTKEAVRQWALKYKILQDSKYRLYPGDPAVVEYIRKNRLKNRIAVTPKNKPFKTEPRKVRTRTQPEVNSGPKVGADEPDNLTPREERLLKNQEMKLMADLRKTEAAATNMELRNMVTRGTLGDIKFLSSMFYQQLHYAIRQFLILPNSTMDDVIALAMQKGESARVDCVNLQNARINQIGEITVAGWEKYLKAAEAELLKISDSVDNG